jgi:hypothetical protein
MARGFSAEAGAATGDEYDFTLDVLTHDRSPCLA